MVFGRKQKEQKKTTTAAGAASGAASEFGPFLTGSSACPSFRQPSSSPAPFGAPAQPSNPHTFGKRPLSLNQGGVGEVMGGGGSREGRGCNNAVDRSDLG